jgi:Dyp-type peroxidase family
MSMAKGVLPRREGKEPIADPRSSGYFVAVTIDPNLDRAGAQALLTGMSGAVDKFVEPIPETGERVAAIAVGFGPTFFTRGGGLSRFDPPLQTPAAFAPDAAPIPSVPAQAIAGDLLLYLITSVEARASGFLASLWALRPLVQAIEVERGYQRTDGTEPFGYADGLRNIPRISRSDVVFVSEERHFEEPDGAVGGSYMAVMKIVQNLDAFNQLAPDQQDAVIGRKRDGTRLDLVGENVPPREEPQEPPPSVAQSHVAKAGPRGIHDSNMVFRRGLPFFEADDGEMRIGLQFCSFQASLDQFDVVWGDWMLNPQFSATGGAAPGSDALLDPSGGLTTIEKFGFYFVPPADDDRRFIGATLFDPVKEHRPTPTGRIAIRKRVSTPSDASARFERGGFEFQIINSEGQVVDTLTTNSAGHAQSGDLPMGVSYTLRETNHPQIPNLQPAPDIEFTLDARRKVMRVMNTVSQPGPYGG